MSFNTLDGESPVVREREISRVMKRRSTNLSIKKSFQSLDEAVSPFSLLKKRKNAQHTYTMNNLKTSTLISTPSPLKKTSTDDEECMKMEKICSGYASDRGTVLLERSYGDTDCLGAFVDFMEALNDYHSQNKLIDLLNRYEEICFDNLNQLERLMKECKPGQSKFAKARKLMEELRREQWTWRLIALLFQDRVKGQVKEDDENMLVDSLEIIDEKEVVERLFQRDSVVRQGQLVIDWLEKNAAENLDNYYDRMEYFADPKCSIENTLHNLKICKNGSNKHMKPLTDQLDPDAQIRQGRPIAELDLEDEHRLLKYVFALIRAGKLEEAQSVCNRFGEPWRSASLEGWRLYYNLRFREAGYEKKVIGNPCRDIWKSVCWRLAEDEKITPYEKAMYATFSGNLEQLLIVCEHWEDYVWAYMRVMVDQRVENELRLTFASAKPTKPLPSLYWENQITPENVFQDIQASPRDQIRKESFDSFNIIQKYIILGNIEGLVEEMHEWTKDEARNPSAHRLRFLSHLVLFLTHSGSINENELCVSILESYVKELIKNKHTHLVAAYVTQLPSEMQVGYYAKFLSEIHESGIRHQCLQLAAECGLDTKKITKMVVEIARNSGETIVEGDLPSDVNISEEDLLKINAIEWLIFDQGQRNEALKQTNALVRLFLSSRKFNAAKEALKRLPADSIDTIMKLGRVTGEGSELNADDANAIRENLCLQSYMIAHDSFNDWFEHCHNAKPLKPNTSNGANFSEKVAFEQEIKHYESELERWRHSLELQSKITEEKIFNVLLFVDGGWMVDQRLDGQRDEKRTHQMRLLRQMCLPNICFLLHTILHTSQQFKKCLQLADIIASEQYHLYKTFRRDELKKLLQKIKDSALCLLDDCLDPTGFDMNAL